MPIDPETRGLVPRCLALTPEANGLLVRFADAIEAEQAPGGDLEHITGTASKAAEQAARIAGVLTLWRDLDAPAVQAVEMANGVALAQFYLGEASRLANAANVSAEVDRAEKLRRWMLDRFGESELVLRDVVRDGPNPLRDGPKAKAAIKLLVEYGWLVPLDPGTVVRGSARREAWRIVRGRADVV